MRPLGEPQSTHDAIVAKFRGEAPGDAPEHGTGHEPGAARVVEVEQPTDQLSCGKQPRDRTLGSIEDPAPVSMRKPPKVEVIPQVTA